jgi:hypothetical protein
MRAYASALIQCTQVPTDLEGSVARRLASIVVPSSNGLGVDLDALLLLLITEYNTGTCPRSAMLFPRRLTDGALFNLVRFVRLMGL